MSVNDGYGTFRTAREDVAGLLVVACGSEVHIETRLTNRGRILFVFRDKPLGKCRGIASDFFSEGSVQIPDARHYAECIRAVRKTAGYARQHGIWTPQAPSDQGGGEQ